MGFIFLNLIFFKNNKYKNDNKYVVVFSLKFIFVDVIDMINLLSVGLINCIFWLFIWVSVLVVLWILGMNIFVFIVEYVGWNIFFISLYMVMRIYKIVIVNKFINISDVSNSINI